MSVFQVATEKKAKGETVYNFSAGDPALPNHPAIMEMTNIRSEIGFVPYPPVEGIHELREAFVKWNNKVCGLNYKAEEVAVTCGGKFALYAILACFLNPGEDVLIIAPYYVSYPGIVTVLGSNTKVIETHPSNDWKITPEMLEQNASETTTFLILNNACNPTGTLYSKEELYAILQKAKALNITVISDEVYSGLVFGDKEFVSCGSFPEFKDTLFIVQSCSKNFAMSGWRVGFILAEKAKLAKIKAFQQQTTSGVSLVSQWGALGAISKGEQVNTYVRDAFKKRLELFVKTFSKLFQPMEMPKSAIYTFIPLSAMGVPTTVSAPELADVLIKQGNIATVPGEAFGVPGYLRFACSESEEEIEQGLIAMHKLIRKTWPI